MRRALVPVVLGLALVGAACSSDDSGDTATGEATTSTTGATFEASGSVGPTTSDGGTARSTTATFTVEVWADNWSSVYANGELVGDDASWVDATVWSAADVSPKDGYDEIAWDPSAQLVWGDDLEVDNTILFRKLIEG